MANGDDELEAIAAISMWTGTAPAGEIWVGDDAAVVQMPAGSGPALFATDAMVAGVHFTDDADLSDVGWSALVRNVSDLAAMGGRATHAVVSVVGAARRDLDALYAGLTEAAIAYGCPIVGGDLSGGPAVVVTVAVIGTCDGRAPVTRAGASAGDVLYLTGALGASAAGLRLLLTDPGARGPLVDAHRRPEARTAEGRLASELGATAMIDVSDGLGLDLHRLAEASGVGFALESVPVAPGATEEDARGGGEEYELLFSVQADVDVPHLFVKAALEEPIRIGSVLKDRTTRTLRGESFPPLGWRHALSAPTGARGQLEV